MMEEDLEAITKQWSMDLLVLADLVEILDINSPKAAQGTLGTNRTKKTKETKKPEEVQDIDSRSVRMTSLTPDEEGAESEQQQVEVPQPRDEADSSNKRKVSPLNYSSRKNRRTPVTNMRTALTLD
jgi:hypothetical protein